MLQLKNDKRAKNNRYNSTIQFGKRKKICVALKKEEYHY